MTGGSVLVVDDSAVSRRKVQGPLEEAGYEVVEAADGEGALARLDEALPDAVLLDYEMPGLDGLEVLDQMTSRGIDLPVIALTAHDDGEVVESFLEAGAIDFLTKGPLMGVRIVNALERARVLARAGAPGTIPPGDPIRVLVVDDSKVARRVVTQGLRSGSLPLAIDEATDGREGLEAALEGGHDVILVDHDLPERDGPELLEALRAQGVETPALALTGSADPKVAERFLESGAYDVWTKDGESALRLRVTVERLARMHRAGDPEDGGDGANP